MQRKTQFLYNFDDFDFNTVSTHFLDVMYWIQFRVFGVTMMLFCGDVAICSHVFYIISSPSPP